MGEAKRRQPDKAKRKEEGIEKRKEADKVNANKNAERLKALESSLSSKQKKDILTLSTCASILSTL